MTRMVNNCLFCRAQYGNMIKNAEDNAKKALKRIWTNYTGEAEVRFWEMGGWGADFFWGLKGQKLCFVRIN